MCYPQVKGGDIMDKKQLCGERLREALAIRDLKQVELCKRTGIPKSAMSQYIKGNFEPKQDRLEKMSSALRVNQAWLLGFDVPMEITAKNATDRWVEKYGMKIKEQKPIPVIGVIRAGLPILAEENIESIELADVNNPDEYFFLRVSGDSMIGAGIIDGSLALIHKQNYAENGQIVAMLVDGENATLKRFKRQGGLILLIAENPKYDPIVLNSSDFETRGATIMGVLKEVKIKFGY